MERLAAYILRPSFAASRLQYDPQQGRVEYRTAKGIHRTLDALDWIALVTSHIPNPGEQMSRYYGRYSNASLGQRRQASTPATGKGASPGRGLGGVLSRRAVLPAAAAQLPGLAAVISEREARLEIIAVLDFADQRFGDRTKQRDSKELQEACSSKTSFIRVPTRFV